MKIKAYQDFLHSKKITLPSIHIVLGSGFGTALDQFPWEVAGELPFSQLPGMPSSTVQDHAGKYRFYRHPKKNLVVSFQMGRLHGYEGHEARDVVLPVMVPRLAGVKNFLLTNASGGLSPAFRPGDLMMIRDQVNLTGKNPLMGPNPEYSGQEIGPRFPDMCGIYDRHWRDMLSANAKKEGLAVHEGTYMGLLGPSFETPAEVQLFASWGIQAVGMSTVWEAIALKHSDARVAGMSLISNLGAGMTDQKLDHNVILETCRASAAKIVGAIRRTIEEEFA